MAVGQWLHQQGHTRVWRNCPGSGDEGKKPAMTQKKPVCPVKYPVKTRTFAPCHPVKHPVKRRRKEPLQTVKKTLPCPKSTIIANRGVQSVLPEELGKSVVQTLVPHLWRDYQVDDSVEHWLGLSVSFFF